MSIAVNIGTKKSGSSFVERNAKSHCITGLRSLIRRCGECLPLACTQIQHHRRYGRCVKLCSIRSNAEGSCGDGSGLGFSAASEVV